MIWKPHVTVAAVIERNRRFLMVEERVAGRRVLNQPAGHLEPEETLHEAVIREVREETAWRFRPEAVVGIYLWRRPDSEKTFLRVAFSGECDQHDPHLPLDSSIINTAWLSRDEILDQQARLRSPMVIRCLEDYLAGRRFPLDMLVRLATDDVVAGQRTASSDGGRPG